MTTETITCSCGTEFQWTHGKTDPEWVLKFTRPVSCPDCDNRREAQLREELRNEFERRLASALAQMRSCVSKETPGLFRGTDISHERFNAAGWAWVKDWHPSDEKPWLGIIGETGTCKTRIACLLAATEMERQVTRRAMKSEQTFTNIPRFQFAACYEISEIAALLQAGTFEQKEEARSYLDAIRRADLLVIDDLGKGRMNASIAAEMFALVNHRYANALPTIWTANSTPEQIASNLAEDMAGPFAEDMAGPFAGRINDSSRIIRFK
jgi:hypothetical protein